MSLSPALWWMILPIAAWLLCGCASAPHDERNRVTLTGVLSFPSGRAPRLVECDTRRQLELGSMADGSYLYLRRRVREVATHRNDPVTVEVSGYLNRAGPDLRMDQVALHGLAPGHCRNIVDYGEIDY